MSKTRNGIGFGYRTGMASKGSKLNQEFIDTFDRADGELGNDWLYNGSWNIASGKLVAAPATTGAFGILALVNNP